MKALGIESGAGVLKNLIKNGLNCCDGLIHKERMKRNISVAPLQNLSYCKCPKPHRHTVLGGG